jgi:hypothetical protein
MFNSGTLQQLLIKRPTTMQQLDAITGLSQHQKKTAGPRLLSIIVQHVAGPAAPVTEIHLGA